KAEHTPLTHDLPPESYEDHESEFSNKPVTSWRAVRDKNAQSTFTKQPKKRLFSNSKPKIVLLIILFSIGAGIWYWNKSQDAGAQFEVAMVSRGDLTKVVTATGQLNPRTTVQVSSQISGMIQRIFVDFNSVVAKRDVLAELDPATYTARVKTAEGELAEAKA